MKAFLGIARAKFLLLPVTLVAVGAAAAAYDGTFDLINTLLALVGLTAMHVSVNSLNEYSDFRRGIDLATERTPFSGGSGTLPSGALPASAALYLGLGAAILGLVIGIYFFSQFGLMLLPIFVLGAISVLGYSDLLSRAYVGEIFAGLGLGTLPVLGTAVVQGGELGAAAVSASIPPFFMTFNLLLLNEFPDEKADQAGGRRNLVRLLGRTGAARAYVVIGWVVPASLRRRGRIRRSSRDLSSGLSSQPRVDRTDTVGARISTGDRASAGARRQRDLEPGYQHGARPLPGDRHVSLVDKGMP